VLHRYSFNGAAGSTAVADTAVVSAWGGTLKNGAVVDTVALGNGQATFNGAGYLSLPNDITESSAAVTIEAWFTGASGNTDWNRLFQFGATAADSKAITLCRAKYGVPGGEAGGLEIQTWLPTTQIRVACATQFNNMPADSHIVAVYDSVVSATFKIYVNGVEIASASTSAALSVAMGNYNRIGAGFWSEDQRLHGTIDDFRIWRSALSASTITDHYSWGPSLISICAAGYYIAHDRGSSCEPCAVGAYVDTSNRNRCYLCTAGCTTISTASTKLSMCTTCPAGRYAISASAKNFALSDVSSRQAMIAGGWKIDCTVDAKDTGYAAKCAVDPVRWSGFTSGDAIGTASARLGGRGSFKLTYGNCDTQNTVKVYVNSVEISSAAANTLSKTVTYGPFADNDLLEIKDGAAIIMIRSFEVYEYFQDYQRCEDCVAGKYSAAGDSACTSCEIGAYSTAGSTACTRCACSADATKNQFPVPPPVASGEVLFPVDACLSQDASYYTYINSITGAE